MKYFNMRNNVFVKFGLISFSNISVMKKKWKYGISIEHLKQFNNDLADIYNSTKELYRVSELS